MATVADVLDRAADLIEVRGLARQTFEAPDGALCTFGAIRVALFGDAYPTQRFGSERWGLYREATVHIVSAVALQTGSADVLGWNDRASTKDVVVAGLRRAAARARGED